MPRSIWTGSVSFGLVNIPVKLFSAVSQKEIHFNMLHDADGARIKMHRFCEAENVEVPYEHIVKGYQVSPNQYVTVTPEELEAIDPKATRSIDIQEFVSLDEIDPIYYDRTYYLGPDKGAGKAYALLLDAMRRSRKVAIGRFVLRTKESLCCLRPLGDAMALATLNYADEVVEASDAIGDIEAGKPSTRELEMAERLIDSLSTKFEPAKFRDEYRDKVVALIEKKAAGEQIHVAPRAEESGKVVNLADALAASLAAARGGGEEPRKRETRPERSQAEGGTRRHRPAAAARTAGPRRRGGK
jgi:DNA end-binding protein Ku